jgi:sugar lactone lactonase YvrE
MITAVASLLVFSGLAAGSTAERPEILIDDRDVYPESITSTRAGAVFTGSLKGIIFRAGPGEAVAKAWIRPTAENGLEAVFGVLADERSKTLWVCSVPNSFQPPKAGAITALIALDLKSGKRKGAYPFPGSSRSVCNDMTVAADGSVYAADTSNGRILKLARKAKELTVFGQGDALKGIDGIAFSGDGTLYANIVTRGVLLRVGIAADGTMGVLTELTLSEPLGGPDGMRLIEGNRFLLAEGTAGRIDEVTIEGDAATIRVLKDGLRSSPGVTLVGQTAYAIEGKIRYMIDPKLKGQDPGPFKAIAIPLK